MEEKIDTDNGWFKIADELGQTMARGDFEAAEHSLLWWLICATYGRKVKDGAGQLDPLKVTDYRGALIARETGKDPKSIKRAGRALLDRRVIIQDEAGLIGINTRTNEWVGTIKGAGFGWDMGVVRKGETPVSGRSKRERGPSLTGETPVLGGGQTGERPALDGREARQNGREARVTRERGPRSQYARAADSRDTEGRGKPTPPTNQEPKGQGPATPPPPTRAPAKDSGPDIPEAAPDPREPSPARLAWLAKHRAFWALGDDERYRVSMGAPVLPAGHGLKPGSLAELMAMCRIQPMLLEERDIPNWDPADHPAYGVANFGDQERARSLFEAAVSSARYSWLEYLQVRRDQQAAQESADHAERMRGLSPEAHA